MCIKRAESCKGCLSCYDWVLSLSLWQLQETWHDTLLLRACMGACVCSHVKQLQTIAVAQLDFSEFIDFLLHTQNQSVDIMVTTVPVCGVTMCSEPGNAKEKPNVQKTWRIWCNFSLKYKNSSVLIICWYKGAINGKQTNMLTILHQLSEASIWLEADNKIM